MKLSFFIVTSLLFFRLNFEVAGASVKPFHFAVLVSAIIAVIKSKMIIKLRVYNFKVLLMLLTINIYLIIIQSFYSYSILYSVFYLILNIVMLVNWVIIMSEFNPQSSDPDKVLSYFFKLVTIASLCLYFYSLPEYLNNKFQSGTDLLGIFVDRGMPRLTGIHSDPNIICLINIPATLFFIFQKNYKNYFFALLSLIALVLTFSRAGLAIFLLVFTLQLLLSDTRHKTIKLCFLGTGVLLFLAMLHAYVDLFEILEKRLRNLGNASGRFVIWNNVWTAIAERPFWGYGPYSMKAYGADFWEKGRLAHNTPLQLWFDQGLIGLSLYYLLYLCIIIIIFLNSGPRSFHFFGFLSICMVSLSVSVGVDEFMFTLFVLLLLSSIAHGRKKLI